MFALTADQTRSRTGTDRVPHMLTRLREGLDGPVLAFERTVGDEIQGLLATGAQVVTACRLLACSGQWHVGIGAGSVERPLPRSTREARGQAFVLAREAVEAAKTRSPSLQLLGPGGGDVEADAVLRLLAALWDRRSAAGWSAVEAVEAARHAAEDQVPLSRVAATLGITHQALSQRLRTAGWALETDALPVAARLADAADPDRASASVGTVGRSGRKQGSRPRARGTQGGER